MTPDEREATVACSGAVCGLTAFGLAISSELPLIGGSSRWAPPEGGRSLAVRASAASPAGCRSSDAEATAILERRHLDGSLGMLVARTADGGYRVKAPHHGTFAIAYDGSVVWCRQREQPAWRWHRPLYSQALPLAAMLQGFELFHASAVVLKDVAVAFVAPSGTGKTSLALRLAIAGATLLADDVLSLECANGIVLAHRGVRLANIPGDQWDLLRAGQRARLGSPLGRSDKVHVELESAPATPFPLGAVYFLERSPDVGRVQINQRDTTGPRELLAATYLPHVTTSERLKTQLATCAQVDAKVPTFKLLAPASGDAASLALAVERHVTSVL